MGKPIVSVHTSEIDKYAEVVRLARNKEEFLAQLDAVISAGFLTEEITRRVGRVVQEGWGENACDE